MARRATSLGTVNRSGLGRRRATDLPGIAVLPYFTADDGIVRSSFAHSLTERVTATLSRVHDLHVTSFNSAISVGRRHSIQDIGARLGVEYILKGQVVRCDQTLSFTQTLFDAQSGEDILAFSFNTALDDLQAFEREVVTKVVAKVLRPLRETEIERILRKSTVNDNAYELTVRAQLAMHKMTRANLERANGYLSRALVLDPDHAAAYAWRTRYHSIRVGQGWAECPKAESELAMTCAEQAVALDDENALALAVLGHMKSFLRRDHASAERLLRRAIACNPNEPAGHMFLGSTLSYIGRATEGRRHNEVALSLSPDDSCLYALLSFLGMACYLDTDYESALTYLQPSLALNPKYSTTLKLMTVTFVAMGRIAEAREMAARLRKLEPKFHQSYPPAAPLVPGPIRDVYFQRLRTAGCFDPKPLGPSSGRRRKT